MPKKESNPKQSLKKLELISECITDELKKWGLSNIQELYIIDLTLKEIALSILKDKAKYPKRIVQRAQQLL